MKIRTIIIDDDLMAQKALTHHCGKFEEIDLIDVCSTGIEGLEKFDNQIYDLLFLDIDMPEMTGLEFLDELLANPIVVFTTSKLEYAVNAFDRQVADFLHKPIKLPRFEQAIMTVKEKLAETRIEEKTTVEEEIYIKEDGRFIRLETSEILYFENTGDYVKIITQNNSHIFHNTMKKIEAKLDASTFLRIHRSYIINLKKIVDIEENNLVIADKVIPISRAKKPELMSRLNLL